MKRLALSIDEPTLAQKMRALAQIKPQFAEVLLARAKTFEDAANNFRECDGEFETRTEYLLSAWRAARQVFFEAQQPEPGSASSHQ